MVAAENIGVGRENESGGAGAKHGEGNEIRQLRTSIEQRLDRLRFGQPAAPGDLAARVLTAFKVEAPRCLDTIANAIDAGDVTTAREQVHDLTSLAGYVGVDDMVRACADLRERLMAGDLVPATQVVAELRGGYKRASQAIAGL